MVVLIPSRRADGTFVFKTCVYGPSEGGRKTVLERLSDEEGLASGKLNEIKDEKGSMLSFERIIGKVYNVIFQVYTFNVSDESNAKIVLKGTDAILFIWDSLIDKWENNISSLKTLLRFYGDKLIQGNDPPDVPIVVLANKRDLEDIVEISKIREVLDTAHLDHTLIYETIATTGVNVKRAFVYATRQAVINHYKKLSEKLKEKKTQKEDAEISELISKYMKSELEKERLKKERLEKRYKKERPIIEKLIQEMKFSDAIRDLNDIKKNAERNHLGEILRWVERNLTLCNKHIIKKTVLELGTKFARLQIAEISEECVVKDEQLIVDTVREMIDNKEIYAQYFSSTKSVAFNQQANVDEIDKLMATYKEWEEKKVEKK